MLSLLVFAGCQSTPPINNQADSQEDIQADSQSLFGPYQLTQHYSEKMQKPDFEKMDNKKEIQAEIYNESWTVDYQISAEEIADLVEAKSSYCDPSRIGIIPYGGDESKLIKLDPNTLQVGDSFKIQGNYAISNLYPLPPSMIQQLQQQGLAF